MKVPVRIYSCNNTGCPKFGPDLGTQVWPTKNNETKQFFWEELSPCACGYQRKLYLSCEVESAGWTPGVDPSNPKIDIGGVK